jgi:hypothetical protein
MPEQRAPQRPPQRTRIFGAGNRFDFDESKKPRHMAYKWLRVSLGGQEDKENQIVAEMNCWTPVPASRHPELSGRGGKDGESIVRGGLMLVEQPIEYEQESRQLQSFEAKDTLETQIQRLGLQGRQNGAARGGVRRQMAPVAGEIVE